MTLTPDLPAGNLKVIRIENKKATVDVEMRDSENEWFYWKFKAVFPETGTYDFQFVSPNKVGTRGPAVSHDRGASWSWLNGTALYEETQSFRYECRTAGEEVWFCQGIPYLQREFDAFAAEFKTNPIFRVSTLCKSRKGRPVERITIRSGNPGASILLTSRHHAQEMMATHVLEGFLRTVLADDEFGREFRSHIAVNAVPFVDKDGVEDGDQGKMRLPHDHGRDYEGETSIYPETGAIRTLVDREKPFFVLDLHCPWIRHGTYNEELYMVQGPPSKFSLEMERFGKILEEEAPACAPYSCRNNIPFGKQWNTSANFAKGVGLKHYCQKKDFMEFAQTLEVPFANFGEITMDRTSALALGKALAHSVLRYWKALQKEKAKAEERRKAVLGFTGDIMCNPSQTAACAGEGAGESPDYRPVFSPAVESLRNTDYLVGNLETPFAGKDAGFSEKLYSFNTPDSFAEALRNAGFRFVSTANNHCLDRGVAGLRRTLDVLDHAGISHVGTSWDPEVVMTPVLQEVDGIRIAFFACTYGTNAFANHEFLKPEETGLVNLTQPQETLPGSVHLLDAPEVIAENMRKNKVGEVKSPLLNVLKQRIAGARTELNADYVIVLMHSGGQYNALPDPYTEFLVETLQKFGADMIVGNHPHVIQKWEMRNGIPVFFSLGNFTFTPGDSPESGKNPFSANSIVVKPVLEKKGGKTAMTGGTFWVSRSVSGKDGRSSVFPLFDLIQNEADPEKKDALIQDYRKSVRIFRNLPETAEVPLLKEQVLLNA